MIDAIKVHESSRKFEEEKATLEKGMGAASALVWFKDNLIGRKPQEVLTAGASLVGFGSFNSERRAMNGLGTAQGYLTAAARGLEAQILEKAVKLAQADFDAAEALRRHRNG